MAYVNDISTLIVSLNINFNLLKDFHGSWESFTGHHSPIYPRTNEKDEQIFLNIDTSIKYWLNNGTPREKIVLGLGTYGRSFTLADFKKGERCEIAVIIESNCENKLLIFRQIQMIRNLCRNDCNYCFKFKFSNFISHYP